MIELFQYNEEEEETTVRAINQLERDLIKDLDAHRFGIMLFNADGDLLAANQQWQRLYMISYEEVKTYNILEDQNLRPKHIWPSIKGAFEGISGVIEENHFSPAEWGKQGRSRWTEGNVFPLLATEGNSEVLLGTALFLNDVTDLKQTQLELERLRKLICDTHDMQMELLKTGSHDSTKRVRSDSSRPKGMPSAGVIRQAARSIPRREREIFELLAAGSTVKEAAHSLNLATKSVYTYRARLMDRLKLHSSVELAVAWREIQDTPEPSDSE